MEISPESLLKLDTDRLCVDIETILHRKELEESFAQFIVDAWPYVEGSTVLKVNWTMEAVCLHLEAILSGDIRNLVINIPPRFTKSLITNVFFPAWVWTKKPDHKFIFSAYSDSLAIRDAVKCRTLITSEWYQYNWPHVKIKRDMNTKREFVLTLGGHRIVTTVGGAGTGKGGDTLIADDPNDAKHSRSPVKLEDTRFWWDKVMSTRLNDAKTGSKVIIQQRIAEGDLTGHVLEQGGYEHLCIPMECDPKLSTRTSIGYEDPRTEEGELAWEERFGDKEIASFKVTLGADGYAGQMQQQPAPSGGSICKMSWLKYYKAIPTFSRIVLSVDCTFKDTEGTDYVVMGVFGLRGPDKYLIHLVRGRMDIIETMSQMRTIQRKFNGTINYTLVEDKANGPAVIAMMKREIAGLLAFNPGHDSKIARFNSIVPQIEAGNLYLPDRYSPECRENFPWCTDLLEIFINELVIFPKGTHDDCVDVVTQIFLKENSAGGWLKEMLENDEQRNIDIKHQDVIKKQHTTNLANMMGWDLDEDEEGIEEALF